MSKLDDLIREAARAAAQADAREGGVRNGAMMMHLLARAAEARQEGLTREEFLASLDDEARAWLNI